MGMSNKRELELTWIGNENRPKLEPRILREDPDKYYHANHVDNLLALKDLEQEFACKNPPYLTTAILQLNPL